MRRASMSAVPFTTLCLLSVLGGIACGGSDSTSDESLAELEAALAVQVPARIQAEDYKTGGEGVGYHDSTVGNAGGKYRADDVDIQVTTDTGGGYNVGWITAGEWLEYGIKVSSAGKYDFKARLASGAAGTKTVHLVIDGYPRAPVSFANTSGWQKFTDVSLGSFTLGANVHTVRFVADTGSFNFNHLDVSTPNGCTPTTCQAQGKNCGTISNGCGGTLACGTCSGGATCGGGGVPNVCGGKTGVYVSGNKLMRDGQPFISRGFTMVGLLSATGAGAAEKAYQHYNQAELDVAKSWGANTLRFQISQRGFDPQDSLHTTKYIDRVKNGVALARQNGFVVALSMQDQSLGGGDATDMPDAQTTRSWNTATSLFNGDPYIIYELFNEPMLKDDAASWVIWKNGGGGVVGHQQLVDQIRATGATNVLVAEGLRVGKSFRNSPLIDDPLNQMAYGIHPYLNSPINTPSVWDDFFGDLTATHPVIATEWNQVSGSSFCHAEQVTLAPQLLSYLKSHDIGLWAWALDFPATLIVDWSYTPTNFVGFTCGVSGDGAGQLVHDYFASY